MYCYMCAQEGKETPAIGMCIVCGMHLCKDHLIRSDIDMWEGGYPVPRQRAKRKLPRILCKECYEALT